MKNLKTILVILMLAVAGFLIFFKLPDDKIVVDNPNLVDDTETLPNENTEKELWEDEISDYYEIKYELSGISDENVIADMNRWISDRVYQFKKDGNFANLSPQDVETLGFNNGMKYSINFKYNLHESKTIKSYILRTEYFTGGAHGNVEIISFNYEKEGGKRLGLNDVFEKSAEEYLPVLSALGDKYFNVKYGEGYFPEGLSPKPSNFGVWYTDDEKITFVFQPYQIAPYAYGIPEFPVVASGVSDFINLDYFAK